MTLQNSTGFLIKIKMFTFLRRGGIKWKFLVCVLVVLLLLFIIVKLDGSENDLYDGGETFRDPEEEVPEDRLLNLPRFKYLLQPSGCMNTKDPWLGIILVTSYVGHDDVRAVHRQGISATELQAMGFMRFFLLAGIPEDDQFITQRSIHAEQRKFGDLIQGDFVENYRNLTYKHVMGLKWAVNRCAHAKFIIKIDDDSVYDIFRVYNYLKEEAQSLTREGLFLAGYLFKHQKPIRREVDKHYVSHVEYSATEFPTYLSGWLYITNPRTARSLLREANRKEFFWIDDTYVTGILAEDLPITFIDLTEWFSANPDFIDCCIRDMKRFNLQCEFVIGPNGGDTKLLAIFQSEARRCFQSQPSICRTRNGAGENIRNTCVTAYKDVLRSSHGNAIVRPIKL